MIYADSSFIVAAYSADRHSPHAMAYVAAQKPKLPFTFLHWPEVAKSFWTNYSNPKPLWEIVQEDLADGIKLERHTVDAERTGRRAAGMIKGHCLKWPKLRSLDVMHVSAAVECQAKIFLSFDTRSFQRLLAHAQGLKVWPVLTAEETAHLD